MQHDDRAVSPILTWLEVYPLPAAAFMRSPLQEQPCKSNTYRLGLPARIKAQLPHMPAVDNSVTGPARNML